MKRELAEKDAAKVFGLKGLRFYECPLTYITEESWEVIRLIYLIDGSGHLLFEGGWADQPFWLVEAFEIFRAESARFLKERDNG